MARATNIATASTGLDYQFVYLQAGDPNDDHLFPKLSLLYPAQAEQILPILGAIAIH